MQAGDAVVRGATRRWMAGAAVATFVGAGIRRPLVLPSRVALSWNPLGLGDALAAWLRGEPGAFLIPGSTASKARIDG